MGQGQQKTTISKLYNNKDPNTQQTNVNTANTPSKDDKFLIYVRESLRNCSSNGFLTKDSFNQVLAVF